MSSKDDLKTIRGSQQLIIMLIVLFHHGSDETKRYIAEHAINRELINIDISAKDLTSDDVDNVHDVLCTMLGIDISILSDDQLLRYNIGKDGWVAFSDHYAKYIVDDEESLDGFNNLMIKIDEGIANDFGR